MANHSLSMKELIDRHQKMLDYQEEIYPFTATLKELQEVWGMNSTCPVRHTLDKLVELDAVLVRQIEKKTHYYAVIT